MKMKAMNKTTKTNFITYLLVIVIYIVVQTLVRSEERRVGTECGR